eukprot:gene30810-40987_t
MIESSLSLASSDILQMEGENCVLSLIQLKFATSDVFSLEIRITKLLLCNFSLWADASFYFLNSLMSVILTGSISIDTEAIALGAEERDLDSFDTSAFEVDQSKAGRNLYYVEEEKESASRSMSEELAQEADRE